MVAQWLANPTRNHKVIWGLVHSTITEYLARRDGYVMSSLLRCLQQHELYTPRGVEVCAGLRQV